MRFTPGRPFGIMEVSAKDVYSLDLTEVDRRKVRSVQRRWWDEARIFGGGS